MGASSVTGKGLGSAEGPIRGLGPVEKILKRVAEEAAFDQDGQKVRSQISGGGGSNLAEDIIVVPTGNLFSNNVQAALKEHQDDIDSLDVDVINNETNIATNATDIAGKADKVSGAVSGDFAALNAAGNLINSGNGPDDYYTQGEIDAMTTSHQALTDLQGGGGDDFYHLLAAEHTNLTGGAPAFDEITLNNAPVDATDAATKGYVDAIAAGASTWLDAVLDFKTEAAATTTLGNRYIASTDGGTWTENNVYEYNGAGWDETVVVAGNSTYVDAESSAYIFNDTDWVKTGGISDHNSLSGLQGGTGGGTPERYHLNQSAAEFTETVNVTTPANQEKLVYDSSTSKWVNDNPDLITHKSSDNTLTKTHGIFFVNTSSGDVTLTIPDSAATNDNSGIMRFYKETTDANIVTIVTVGGQDIGGESSQVISNTNQGFSIVSDYNGGSNQAWEIIQDNRTAASSLSQVFDVAKFGTPYTQVEDAINAINTLGDAADDKRYVVRVASGTYTENPLTVPSYVVIQGLNDEATVIKASNNNSPLFSMSDESQLYTLRTSGPTNDVAVLVDGGIETKLIGTTHDNCITAIQGDGNNTIITAKRITIKSGVTTGLLSTDNAEVHVSEICSTDVTNHLYANGGTIHFNDLHATGGTNAIYANNGGVIMCQGAMVHETTNVVRSGDTGVNVFVGGHIISQGNTTWDILQENATGDFHLTGCSFFSTKLSITNPALVKIDFDNDLEGDEGHVFTEELHVGLPEQGRESVFGEGDSYTRGMLVYTETALGAFTNVSTAAASASGSSFTFPGVAVDNAIYVSSDLQDATDYKQFLGIKSKITVAAVLGAGNFIVEYWNGSEWIELNHMSTDADSPYESYANNIFERPTTSEQIRFQDLTLSAATWTKNDPSSTGTNRFWVRFRIENTITTAPVFEQFQVHSNRTEINADGFVEHMGKARNEEILEGINLANTIPIVGKSPGNKNILFGTTIQFATVGNEFTNNASDGFGQAFGVPADLDTSLPLTYVVRWAPSDNAPSGDVVLDFTYGEAILGLVLDGTNTETTVSGLITTTSSTANEIYSTEFEFSIPNSLPKSGVFFMLQRQASGNTGPTGDTYKGNIYIVNVELFGWHWN